MNSTVKKRAPMTFSAEAPAAAMPSVVEASVVTTATIPESARKKIGTSLPPDLYRQAKARAALDDVSIQEVIETALREFIARGKQH